MQHFKDISSLIQTFSIEKIKEVQSAIITGATGSGKSWLLHSIIKEWIRAVPVAQRAIYILDPKRVEYFEYKDKQDEQVFVYDSNLEQMKKALLMLSEMETPVLIVIDEMSDLLMTEPKYYESLLIDLANKENVCIFISTSRSSHDIATDNMITADMLEAYNVRIDLNKLAIF